MVKLLKDGGEGIPLHYSERLVYRTGASEDDLVSPVTISEATEFVPPADAICFDFSADVAVKISDVADASTGYRTIPAHASFTVPCPSQRSIFLTPVAGNAVIDFHFETVRS